MSSMLHRYVSNHVRLVQQNDSIYSQKAYKWYDSFVFVFYEQNVKQQSSKMDFTPE